MTTEIENTRKLEKILIAKRILLKKVAIMPCGQMVESTGTIFNIPVHNIDVTNLLSSTADSIVKVKPKCKVEYRGHVLFKAVRADFLRRVLSYLKINNCFYKDMIVRNGLEEVIPQVDVRLMMQKNIYLKKLTKKQINKFYKKV